MAQMQDLQKKAVSEAERRAVELTTAEVGRLKARHHERLATAKKQIANLLADKIALQHELHVVRNGGHPTLSVPLSVPHSPLENGIGALYTCMHLFVAKDARMHLKRILNAPRYAHL